MLARKAEEWGEGGRKLCKGKGGRWGSEKSKLGSQCAKLGKKNSDQRTEAKVCKNERHKIKLCRDDKKRKVSGP